jgi:aryl-alcohol dehydrogenase-like predicted oxidoreductase
MRHQLTDETKNAVVKHLAKVADELDCSIAQLAIAWCASNPNVTSVITGASRPSQVTENMAALEVLDRLDDEALTRIEEILEA